MNRAARVLLVLLLLPLVGYLGWRGLPTTNCCDLVDREYAEYESLVARAASGDVVATEQLYREAKVAGHLVDARRWALVGAMANSEVLFNEYVGIYKTLSVESRVADDAVIRKNLTRPGARQLAVVLGIGS